MKISFTMRTHGVKNSDNELIQNSKGLEACRLDPFAILESYFFFSLSQHYLLRHR